MEFISDYMLNSHDKLLFIIAAISIIIELTLIGLSGPLLFFSIGCLITGCLVYFQIINGWELEVLSVGLSSLLSAIILWKPLQLLQGPPHIKDESSDLIGQHVMVSEIITDLSGSIRHSGINWPARLQNGTSITEIENNTKVTIIGVSGNILFVIPMELNK